MSATFETDKFSYYFRSHTRNGIIKPPTVVITKENKFRTLLFYAEHLSSIGKVYFIILVKLKFQVSYYRFLNFLKKIQNLTLLY